MVKYRNQRELDELDEVDIVADDPVMAEEPRTVEDAIFKKRYADSRRGHAEFAKAKEAEIEDLKNRLEHAHKAQIKLPKSEEEILEWQRSYPEFAGILEAIVQKRIGEGLRESANKLQKIEERQRDLEAQEAIIALLKIHPDFDKLKNDEKFHEWLGSQKKRYQDAIYNSYDVEEAAFVIDKYKSQLKGKSEKVDDSRSRASAAEAVRTASVASDITNDFGDYDFTESQIETNSRRDQRWFEQNEDKIMKAYRAGRVLMDISGAAQ